MQTKTSDLVISGASLLSVELLGIVSNASEFITTACQVAIAAATIYRLIKDNSKK